MSVYDTFSDLPHPGCLCLDSFQTFLPNHSLGKGGAFTGMLIAHGDYDLFGRILHNGKCGKWIALGKVKTPTDFVDKAKIPNDVQVIIEQGGFAVYAELYKGKIRTRFFGNPSNNDIRRCFREIRRSLKDPMVIDEMIDVNGTTRKRPRAPPPAFLLK